MSKKFMLIIISLICFSALTACSPAQANTGASSSVAGTAAPQAASPSAISSQSAAAGESASSSGSASNTPNRTLTNAGITIEDVIKEDSLNKNYANDESLKAAGESITATINENTLTFYVMLDKDIKKSAFSADMQAKYQAEMQTLIDTLNEEYDGLPDTTFIYNLMNKSGDILLTLTQEYKEH